MEKKIDCYENQVVDHVSWPFYRYTALLPEQIGGDMFVWLFLSLCVYVNETNGHSKDAYPKETVDTVRRMLTEKFSSVIDGQTLDKIQANAERDFVKDGKIKEETFSFLSTYENLFSDKLEKKYVFQDAITGEIVPNFDDHLEVDDGEGEGKAISERSVKSPTKLSIKRHTNSIPSSRSTLQMLKTSSITQKARIISRILKPKHIFPTRKTIGTRKSRNLQRRKIIPFSAEGNTA